MHAKDTGSTRKQHQQRKHRTTLDMKFQQTNIVVVCPYVSMLTKFINPTASQGNQASMARQPESLKHFTENAANAK